MPEIVNRLRCTRCTSCGTPIAWGVNRTSGAKVPIDPKGTVYVMHRPPDGETAYPVETAHQFLMRAEKVVMLDGTEVRAVDLRLQVTHFATCPNAKEHSQANRQARIARAIDIVERAPERFEDKKKKKGK